MYSWLAVAQSASSQTSRDSWWLLADVFLESCHVVHPETVCIEIGLDNLFLQTTLITNMWRVCLNTMTNSERVRILYASVEETSYILDEML